MAYVNHSEATTFVRQDWTSQISQTKLAGYFAFYAARDLAFRKFDQFHPKRREDFVRFVTLDGIAAYAQYIVKEELHLSQGYNFDPEDERNKLEDFLSHRLSATAIGRNAAKRLHEDSGQPKIIWAMIVRGSYSGNFDVEVHEMDKEVYSEMLRKCPPEVMARVKFDESKNAKIAENKETIGHLFFQKRQFRDAAPYIRNLVDLLDSETDSEEKFQLMDILNRYNKSGDESRIKPTSELEFLPEKTIIQEALISIDARYIKSDIRKRAIIR